MFITSKLHSRKIKLKAKKPAICKMISRIVKNYFKLKKKHKKKQKYLYFLGNRKKARRKFS